MYTEIREKQINYYLKLSGAILIGLLSVLTLFWMSVLSRQMDNSYAAKTITVSGYAEAKVKPDIRIMYISIIGKGSTEKVAQNDASVKSKQVSDYLKEQKIADKDIKSQSISTYPEYKNNSDCPVNYGSYRPCVQSNVIVGYNTNQSIEVTLRGEMMDKASSLVVELTNKGVTVQTGEATVENPEKQKTELSANAIMDARKNAEKLADALGVRLGKVQSFSEDGGYPITYGMTKDASISARPEAAPSPMPVISDGTQKISSTVSVSFEIR